MGNQHPNKINAADYLIAIIACEGVYDDKEEMFLACEKEVLRLLQDRRAMFVYWNGVLWSGGIPRDITYDGLTQDSTAYLEQLSKDIVELTKNFPEYTSWALLVGAHTRRPKTSTDHQSVFDLNTGLCQFSIQYLINKLFVTLLMIDACNGNQINMEGMDVPYVICALDSVGYTGIVGKNFWSYFPNPFEIVADAEHSEKRRARWRIIIKVE